MNEQPLQIDVEILAKLRSSKKPHLVLDVREPMELAICTIADSLAIPMQEIPSRLEELPKDRQLVVICHLGIRSRDVVHFLRSEGFKNAVNLIGGIEAWAQQIDRQMPRY